MDAPARNTGAGPTPQSVGGAGTPLCFIPTRTEEATRLPRSRVRLDLVLTEEWGWAAGDPTSGRPSSRAACRAPAGSDGNPGLLGPDRPPPAPSVLLALPGSTVPSDSLIKRHLIKEEVIRNLRKAPAEPLNPVCGLHAHEASPGRTRCAEAQRGAPMTASSHTPLPPHTPRGAAGQASCRAFGSSLGPGGLCSLRPP